VPADAQVDPEIAEEMGPPTSPIVAARCAPADQHHSRPCLGTSHNPHFPSSPGDRTKRAQTPLQHHHRSIRYEDAEIEIRGAALGLSPKVTHYHLPHPIEPDNLEFLAASRCLRPHRPALPGTEVDRWCATTSRAASWLRSTCSPPSRRILSERTLPYLQRHERWPLRAALTRAGVPCDPRLDGKSPCRATAGTHLPGAGRRVGIFTAIIAFLRPIACERCRPCRSGLGKNPRDSPRRLRQHPIQVLLPFPLTSVGTSRTNHGPARLPQLLSVEQRNRSRSLEDRSGQPSWWSRVLRPQRVRAANRSNLLGTGRAAGKPRRVDRSRGPRRRMVLEKWATGPIPRRRGRAGTRR